MTVCVEPIMSRQRQNQVSIFSVRIPGRTGVAGQACGESYPREDGRDCSAPMRTTVCTELIEHPIVGSDHAHRSVEVTIRINGSEIGSKGIQPVRQENSRDETSVMEADPKVPDFCNASGEGQGNSSRQTRREEA